MTGLSTSDWLQVLSMLVAGGAVYGAIRADLAALHKRVDYLYARIDAHKP